MLKCPQCYQDLITDCYNENNSLILHQYCLKDHLLINDLKNYSTEIEIKCDNCEIYFDNRNELPKNDNENEDKKSETEQYEIHNIKPEKKYEKEFYFYRTKDMFLCKNCTIKMEQNDFFKFIKLEEINNDYKKETGKDKICYSILKNKLFCEWDEYKKADENIIIINEMKKNLNINEIKNYINECSKGDYFVKIKEAVVNQIEKLKNIIKNLNTNLNFFEKYFKKNLLYCKNLISLYEKNNINYQILHNLNNINYNNYKKFENINLNDEFDIENINKLNDFLKNGLPYKFISKEEFIKNENNLSKIREKYFIEKEMPFYDSNYKMYKQINNDFYNENQDLNYNPSKITYKIEYLLKKNILYSGEFSNTNKNPEGIGIKKFNKGDIYIGNFENGKYVGYGKYKEINGTIYKGYWKDGRYDGFGKITFKNGISFYLGYFKKGKKNGYGIYYFENHDFYIGEWKDDNRDGFGLYFQKEKNIYYGYFKNNFKNGLGIFYFKCPKIYDKLQKYLNNFGKIKSENILKEDFIDFCMGDKYIGEYINSFKTGIGIYELKNNNMTYEGQFNNGNYEGYGILKDNKNNFYEGYFYNDEIYYGIKYKNEYIDVVAGFFENFEINGLKYKIEKINPPIDFNLLIQSQAKKCYDENFNKLKNNEDNYINFNQKNIEFVIYPDYYVNRRGINKNEIKIIEDNEEKKIFYAKKEELKQKIDDLDEFKKFEIDENLLNEKIIEFINDNKFKHSIINLLKTKKFKDYIYEKIFKDKNIYFYIIGTCNILRNIIEMLNEKNFGLEFYEEENFNGFINFIFEKKLTIFNNNNNDNNNIYLIPYILNEKNEDYIIKMYNFLKNSMSMFLFIEFYYDEKYKSTNKKLIKLEKSLNYLNIKAKINGSKIIINNTDILSIFEKINIKPKKNDLMDIKLNDLEKDFKLIIKRYLKDEKFLDNIENFYKNLKNKKDLKDLIENYTKEMKELQSNYIKFNNKVLNFFLSDFGLKIETEKFTKKYIKNKIKNFYISKIYEKIKFAFIDNNLYNFYFKSFLNTKKISEKKFIFQFDKIMNSNIITNNKIFNFTNNLNESIFLINVDCYNNKDIINIKNFINEKSSFYLFNEKNFFNIFILDDEINKNQEIDEIIFQNKKLNQINLIIFTLNYSNNNKIFANIFKEKYIFNEIILNIIDIEKDIEINEDNFKNLFISNKVKINKNNILFNFNMFISNVQNINNNQDIESNLIFKNYNINNILENLNKYIIYNKLFISLINSKEKKLKIIKIINEKIKIIESKNKEINYFIQELNNKENNLNKNENGKKNEKNKDNDNNENDNKNSENNNDTNNINKITEINEVNETSEINYEPKPLEKMEDMEIKKEKIYCKCYGCNEIPFYSIYDENNEKYIESKCINNHYLKINILNGFTYIKQISKINNNEINNICVEHNKKYIFYCVNCKKNLCEDCNKNEHFEIKEINYNEFDNNDLFLKIEELEKLKNDLIKKPDEKNDILKANIGIIELIIIILKTYLNNVNHLSIQLIENVKNFDKYNLKDDILNKYLIKSFQIPEMKKCEINANDYQIELEKFPYFNIIYEENIPYAKLDNREKNLVTLLQLKNAIINYLNSNKNNNNAIQETKKVNDENISQIENKINKFKEEQITIKNEFNSHKNNLNKYYLNYENSINKEIFFVEFLIKEYNNSKNEIKEIINKILSNLYFNKEKNILDFNNDKIIEYFKNKDNFLLKETDIDFKELEKKQQQQQFKIIDVKNGKIVKSIELIENRIAILLDNGIVYLYNNEFNLEKEIKFKNKKITNIFKLSNNKIVLFIEKTLKILEIGDGFLSFFNEFTTTNQYKFLLEFKNKYNKEINKNNNLYKFNEEIIINNNILISNDNEIMILTYEKNKYKKIYTIKCKNISKIQLINEFYLLVSSYKDKILYVYNLLDDQNYSCKTIENFNFNNFNLDLVFPSLINSYNSGDCLYINKDGLNLIELNKNNFRIIKTKKINNMEEIVNIEQKNNNELFLFFKTGKINKLTFDKEIIEDFNKIEIKEIANYFNSNYDNAYQVENKNIVYERAEKIKIIMK